MDKTFLLVVLLFIGVGYLGYTQYEETHGGRSPVEAIIDFAGLSKGHNVPHSYQKSENDYYRFEYKRRLERLMDARKKVEDQRLKLVKDRRDILKKLLGIDNQVIDNAKTMKTLLDKDRDKFMDQFPELKRLCNLINKGYNTEDKEQREKMYAEAQEELWDIFKSINEDPKNIDKLALVMEEMEQIVYEGLDAKVKGCPKASECLAEDVNCLQDVFMKQVETLVNDPEKDMDKIIELTKLLKFENRLITNNTEGTEDLYWQGSQRIESDFKDMVEQLVSVTEKNLYVLMDYHDDLEKEHMMLFKNLMENKDRYFNVQKRVGKQIRGIIGRLKKGKYAEDMGPFVQKYDSLHTQRIGELEKYFNNEKSMERELISIAQEREDFIYELAESVNIDLDELLFKREQEEETQRKHSAQAQMQWKQVKDRNEEMKKLYEKHNMSDLDKVRARKPDLLKQKYRQQDVNRDMQKARDKMKDAGF